MKRQALEKVVRNRFKSRQALRKIIDDVEKDQRQLNLPPFLTGTYRGQFYRIRVPPKSKVLPDVGRLRSPTSPPKPFTHLPPPKEKPAGHQSSQRERITDFTERLMAWFKENANTMVLNAGSICTLIGFTRSDVLELRCFSAAGSMASVLYSFNISRYPPMMWSGLFALVNGVKIFQILQERKAHVRLDARQEDTYVQFFLQHGVTPKQFEFIDRKAKILKIPKDTFLVKQGEKLDHVYLIVEGTTRASILGRRLTAASFQPQVVKQGGASGAWVGEMAFLEYYWNKEKKTSAEELKEKAKEKTNGVEKIRADQIQVKPQGDEEDMQGRSFYTIVALEDCLVMQWSHKDMEELMKKSTDMRAALTRAMTSAIVGKVVNFTVSRSSGGAHWMHWLEDWRYSDAKVLVQEDAKEDRKDLPAESTPSMPIKKFA